MTPARPKPQEQRVVIHPSWRQTAAVIAALFAVGTGASAFHKAVVMPNITEEMRVLFASRDAIADLAGDIKDMRDAVEFRLRMIEDRLLQLERNK